MPETLEDAIRARLETVNERIEAAAARAGRDRSEVQVVAVSKGQSLDAVRAGYTIGLRWFGENRVRQGLQKIEALADFEGVAWHMIGHVQSRKAKLVAPGYDWVHSVDRLKIARYLDQYAQEAGRKLPVLLECNVSGEEAKYGFELADREAWPGWLEQLQPIIKLPNLTIMGLMTMAPWQAAEEVVRQTFRTLYHLRQFLREQAPQIEWRHLSMGMTDDYEIAVEEGATILRVGRAIFGPRS
jgi:hypothetical protein